MSAVAKLMPAEVSQNDRLRLALDSGGIGTWDWDLSEGRLSWDDRTHELYGLKPGDFSGTYEDFLALLHPEDRGLLAEQLMQIGESRATDAHEVEYRVQLPDGQERYLADRSEALLDSDGQIIRMIGVTWDITKRKQAEQELEYARQQADINSRRMKRDLLAAARIQQSLLPEQGYLFKNKKSAWLYKPCDELAGDSLNIFSVSENELLVYVLDVCGHGVPSSLLAVSVTRSLSRWGGDVIQKTESGQLVVTRPDEVAARLNRLYPMTTDSRLYFTLLYGILNVETGVFNYVSAGNQGPVLVKYKGEVEVCDTPAVPIGLLPDSTYHASNLQLEPGDRLYLCTDGVSEERNNSFQPFGRERLSATLDSHRKLSIESSLESMLSSLTDWSDSTCFTDDIAMIALEVDREMRCG